VARGERQRCHHSSARVNGLAGWCVVPWEASSTSYNRPVGSAKAADHPISYSESEGSFGHSGLLSPGVSRYRTSAFGSIPHIIKGRPFWSRF
jgi:hypothetical protein